MKNWVAEGIASDVNDFNWTVHPNKKILNCLKVELFPIPFMTQVYGSIRYAMQKSILITLFIWPPCPLKFITEIVLKPNHPVVNPSYCDIHIIQWSVAKCNRNIFFLALQLK